MTDYFNEHERLLDDVQLVDNYSFEVGNILLEIDKSVDNSQSVIENIIDNSQLLDSLQTNSIDNSQMFSDTQYVTNNYGLSGKTTPAASQPPLQGGEFMGRNLNGVTVNYNAYNEINSAGVDIDSVLSSFGERLAEAVASAVEGIH